VSERPADFRKIAGSYRTGKITKAERDKLYREAHASGLEAIGLRTKSGVERRSIRLGR
jgi:hypothetical protein